MPTRLHIVIKYHIMNEIIVAIYVYEDFMILFLIPIIFYLILFL